MLKGQGLYNIKELINNINPKTGVVVFAHPDDETCWAGGLISSFPNIKWTSICCSFPRKPHEFNRKFDYIKACTSLNVTPNMIEKVEADPKRPLERMADLKSLDINQYDLIVTHGKDGDYGHVHHKSVHNQVVSLANKLVVGTSYTGNYVLSLSQEVFNKKMDALKKYKTNSYRIDERNVDKWEALLHVYPVLKSKEEKFEIYSKESYGT